MKLKLIIIFLSIVYSLLFMIGLAQSKTTELYFFFGQGCPYCAQMNQNLIEIQKDYPDLKIIPLEVWYNSQNANLLNALAAAYKTNISGVPVIFIGETMTQGVDSVKVFQLREAIRRCSISDCVSPLSKIKTSENKPSLNYKNIAIIGGILIFILILIVSLRNKKK